MSKQLAAQSELQMRDDGGIYIKGARKPIAQVVKSTKHKGMWHVHYNDGDVSIPLNRTRALDTAWAFARNIIAAT